jgi:hypothetical protein
MRRLLIGATLAAAGIVALLEAYSRRPIQYEIRIAAPGHIVQHIPLRPEGLSPSSFDLLRISGWALVIVGVLLVFTRLIGRWTIVRSSQ